MSEVNQQNKKEIIVPEKITDISPKMVKAAFFCLITSVLQEPFICGDTKMILMYSMLNKIESMNFTDEEIKTFKEGVNEIIFSFKTSNSFMG